jgi:hypothetical protein
MQRMTALDRIRHLSEIIGPRGSTTELEAKAADYVAEQLTAMQLNPQKQNFLSAESAYAPYALFAAMTLLSLFLFWQPQPVGAAAATILTVTALVSVILELLFRTNPLRWLLPLDDSQNVFARIPRAGATAEAAASPAHTVFITAHVDTHRTPLVFSSPEWLKVFNVLMPAALVSAGVMAVLFLIGVFTPAAILRQVALVPGAVMLAILILMIQADRTDFSPGAEDNASGVAVTLGLAERLVQAPLKNTDVVVVFTGCEEVGCYGADAFFKTYADQTRGAALMVIDQVGAAGAKPRVVESQRFLEEAPSDPHLLAIARDVLAAHPELQASFTRLSTTYGELIVGVMDGLRCIALGAQRDDGSSQHWHKKTDTLDHVDLDLMGHEEELAWYLLQAIDAANADEGTHVATTPDGASAA